MLAPRVTVKGYGMADHVGATETAPVPWAKPAYAWYVLILLVIAYAFAVVDRIIIGLLVEPMKADLGINDTQIGLLQGLAFAIFYTLFGLPMGVLVDRWKRVRLLAMGVFVWSAATVACGFAKTYPILFLSRIGVGAGESTVTPASSSIIADLFPPSQRPRAYGIFMVGGTIGTAMAYVLGAFAIVMAETLRETFPALLGNFRDWQIAFMAVGFPGVLLSILVITTIREPLRRDRLTKEGEKLSFKPVLAQLNTHRLAYLTLMGGAVLNVMVVNAQLAWLPSLFTRVHGWSSAQIGTTLGLIGLPCGGFSALSAGVILMWLNKRGRTDGPILLVMLQAIMWAIFGTIKCLAPDPTVALVAHAITSLFAVWSVTAALAGLNQITPNEMRGQVIALYMLMTGLVGVSLGPLMVGFLSDQVFSGPLALQPALACAYGFGGALAVALLITGRKAFSRSVDASKVWTTKA